MDVFFSESFGLNLYIFASLVVIYGVVWHTWGLAKLNFSNLIKDVIPLKTLTYKKH